MSENRRILNIGIASLDEIKANTIAVARGERRPGADEPKVWFTSIESLAQVLSTRNSALLELIAQRKPQSVAELAALSGRETSNLSRTLSTLARYGLVTFERGEGGRKVPRVVYDEIRLRVPLDTAPASSRAA